MLDEEVPGSGGNKKTFKQEFFQRNIHVDYMKTTKYTHKGPLVSPSSGQSRSLHICM